MAVSIVIRKAPGLWVVRSDNSVLAETEAALELIEGSRPPVLYFPRADVAMELMDPSETTSHCPHKGNASYYTLVCQSGTIPDAAWSYENPLEEVAAIASHLAFYPGKVIIERIQD